MKRILISCSIAMLILIMGIFAYFYNTHLSVPVSYDEGSSEAAVLPPTPEPTPTPQPTPTPVLVPFDGRVEHIFFHPLIAFPELTFLGDSLGYGFDDWFVTVPEFNRIIQTLYERDFILVDINLTFIEENGEIKKRPLMLPEGKKPLVISVDDINYYEYMLDRGMVHKLILDENGDVVTYTKRPDGTDLISKENEIVPILDQFVKEHPDFSFEGAKGTLGLTGYEGILGYRTHADSPNRQQEIEAVKPIVKRLLETGWNFASHSYTHSNMPNASYQKVEDDTRKWNDEVASLVGAPKIYIYPYGAGFKEGDQRLEILKSYGFRSFCHVGSESYYKFTKAAVFSDRRHIDGIAFRQLRQLNLDLFDADEIIDSVRPSR